MSIYVWLSIVAKPYLITYKYYDSAHTDIFTFFNNCEIMIVHTHTYTKCVQTFPLFFYNCEIMTVHTHTHIYKMCADISTLFFFITVTVGNGQGHSVGTNL